MSQKYCRRNDVSADVKGPFVTRRRARGNRGTHFDARLYPPVPLVLLEHFLFEEETRVETAHVAVRLGAAVLRFCGGKGVGDPIEQG